ncbi:hypothetical protein [Streptomyces echinatus]
MTHPAVGDVHLLPMVLTGRQDRRLITTLWHGQGLAAVAAELGIDSAPP